MKANQSIKIIKSWTLVCFIMLGICLNSCVFEESKSLEVDSAEEALVTFSINTPSSTAPVATTNQVLDSDVRDVSVLVFNTDHTFYYTAYGTNLKNQDSVTKTFQVRLPTGTWRLMVLANARTQGISWGEIKAGDTLDAIVQKLTSEAKRWDASDVRFCIPMWGDIKEQTIDENIAAINVSLVRMLAKVEVLLAEEVTNFELTSVSLYNYHTQGWIIPMNFNDVCWSSESIGSFSPSIHAEWVKEKGPLSYSATNNECVGLIYMFESEKGTKENHVNNTCLVIGGKYDEQQAETYYRVDFGKYNGMRVESYLDVLRNHNYEVEVQEVTSSGFINKEDALESTVANIVVSVTPWELINCTNVIYCGSYYMAFSTRNLNFEEGKKELEVIIHTNLKESDIKITEGEANEYFSCDFKKNDKETEEYILTVTSKKESISSSHITIQGKSLEVKIGVSWSS